MAPRLAYLVKGIMSFKTRGRKNDVSDDQDDQTPLVEKQDDKPPTVEEQGKEAPTVKDQDKKSVCHEYEVFVHTPNPNLSPRQEIEFFLDKVKEGRVEVIKKKYDYLLKDRRGLCIYVTHKSRRCEDVVECIRCILESTKRDPGIDHCKLIRHCPRLPGEAD
ncbi:hypothetical protein P170DRAFT_472365 [Aspergillus steynii IBT 23096]|uniref:Uncharacterized protein n=1 Tax=Aspergillus steynii IBT 23096 TaxID=1392250 RepID=A0A2I2GHW1_9EURO|nr:uncharacterized protein P170DRAFT_472365 [Aspergillus steynii IBT 23096]PLB52473.1 hypothetical protein P170DRAFT_472365 [Aspergillus steynii IBT 23096]